MSVKGELIQRISHTKFFDVHIDENMNWDGHINDVCTNVLKMCEILYPVRNQLTIESMLIIS